MVEATEQISLLERLFRADVSDLRWTWLGETREATPKLFEVVQGSYNQERDTLKELLGRPPEHEESLGTRVAALGEIELQKALLPGMTLEDRNHVHRELNLRTHEGQDKYLYNVTLKPFEEGLLHIARLYMDFPIGGNLSWKYNEKVNLDLGEPLGSRRLKISTKPIRSTREILEVINEEDQIVYLDRLHGIEQYLDAFEKAIGNGIVSSDDDGSMTLQKNFADAPRAAMALLGVAYGIEMVAAQDELSEERKKDARYLAVRAYKLSGMEDTLYVRNRLTHLGNLEALKPVQAIPEQTK